MTIRYALALGLLVIACGGESDQPVMFPQLTAGTTGEPGSGGTEAVSGVSGAAGNEEGGSASQGGSVAATAGDGSEGGSAPAAGAGGTAEPTAGASGAGSGGHAGGSGGAGGSSAPSGGAGAAGGTGDTGGGQAEDLLTPKPAANCPGYVDILVPLNTCLWFHGAPARSTQNTACNVIDPPATTACETVSAVNGDITARVSAGANFERLVLDPQTGFCEKLCN